MNVRGRCHVRAAAGCRLARSGHCATRSPCVTCTPRAPTAPRRRRRVDRGAAGAITARSTVSCCASRPPPSPRSTTRLRIAGAVRLHEPARAARDDRRLGLLVGPAGLCVPGDSGSGSRRPGREEGWTSPSSCCFSRPVSPVWCCWFCASSGWACCCRAPRHRARVVPYAAVRQVRARHLSHAGTVEIPEGIRIADILTLAMQPQKTLAPATRAGRRLRAIGASQGR